MRKNISFLAVLLIGLLVFICFYISGRVTAQLSDRVINTVKLGFGATLLPKNPAYLYYQTAPANNTMDWSMVNESTANNGRSINNIVHSNKSPQLNRIDQPTPVRTSQAPTPSRNSTIRANQNLTILARLVYGEARGESFIGQVAVAAVVLNRIASKNFGNTMQEVILEPGAFTAVSDGQYNLQPDITAYQAAQAALDGWDPTGNALYYWNPDVSTNKWVRSLSVTVRIGQHVFAG